MRPAEEEVANRIATSTNVQNTNDSDDEGDDETASKQSQYKVGDFVRATYAVDGLDYEAKIVSIDTENENCLVRFLGYDNEETIELKNLLLPWGKVVRRRQIRSVRNAYDTKSEYPNTSIPVRHSMPPMLNDTTQTSENMSTVESENTSPQLMTWFPTSD